MGDGDRKSMTANRPGSADLHVHTTHSDGSYSPGEVVRAAELARLSAVAITDHDTVSALAVAKPEAARLGIELIGGVELTAEQGGREIHILGHFVSDDDPDLVSTTNSMRIARSERLDGMIARLSGLGLKVDRPSLERAFPRATLGRRHLADWLAKSGQVRSRREAFDGYLADGGPAEVRKPRLAWERAIALIRGAGGVAALAHPPYDLVGRALAELADGGLGAIEVGGPGVDARRGRRLRDWAGRLGLVPVAGSDFHAPDRPGRWVGAIVTGESELERLRSLATVR